MGLVTLGRGRDEVGERNVICELLWVLYGQHAEHDRVDETEDGGVCANAESERKQRDRGDNRRFAQDAKGETNILNQRVEELGAAGFASFFFAGFEAAELREGTTARFLGRHASGYVVSGLLLDVEAQFGVELGILLAFAK